MDPTQFLGPFAVAYTIILLGGTGYSLYLGYKQSLVKKNTDEIIVLLREQNEILKTNGRK